MGDFADTTDYGDEAYIHLHGSGVVESFPLPDGLRRWVVKTKRFSRDPSWEFFADLVRQRAGVDLARVTPRMLSPFGVQRYMASAFFKGRVILAGDAAHIVSPFGGQGMNLGWLDAWDVARALERTIVHGVPLASSLEPYQRIGRRRTYRAIHRAEFNMALGRERRWTLPRNVMVWMLLHTPLAWTLADVFTLRRL
jgi:2-polyprenyl-6-methoxyphenol hydroxylase-like FAD-dependent oxidoreductase